MTSLKRRIKNVFINLHALYIVDQLNYAYSLFKYAGKNIKYREQHPDFGFPPNYYLYETYKLDFKEYKEDGEVTAQEIVEWTSKYIPAPLKILEWGCGVGRIIRHLPNLVDKDSKIFGVDINAAMIQWNAANISNVHFQQIDYCPPTSFNNNQFDLVFALSVFTHIEIEFQSGWLAEMHRIMSDKGIFLFTTHGKKYEINLGAREKETLHNQGALTIDYQKKGHRMMSTYNSYQHFKIAVERYFDVLEYYCGMEHPEKLGGQDVWIVRKRKLS